MKTAGSVTKYSVVYLYLVHGYAQFDVEVNCQTIHTM